MKPSDRNLGMEKRITRRDLLHGAGAIAAASFVPGQAFADEMLALERAGGLAGYPPARTGMRGNHPGSFHVAHQLAREGRRDWGPVEEPDNGIYDLVVVGAGISGLAAAHFYRQSNPEARILILDNHDDFGGHAKRNEFDIGGKKLIGYGGSQTMETPSGYRSIVKTMLRDIGVDFGRFDTAYDQGFYKRHGLGSGLHFNKSDWGTDSLVRFEIANLLTFIPFAPTSLSAADAVAQMPMSDLAREQMLRLITVDQNQMCDLSDDEIEEYLYETSYRDFLTEYLGITEPEVFATLQYLTGDSTVGIESTSAAEAMGYSGLPGGGAAGLSRDEDDEPYIHHFPDGNASVARMLVRAMIPDVAPGSTMEDIVNAPFDYGKLDVANSPVRLRLNSTVTRVKHDGEAGSAKTVSVSYVRDGRAFQVRAGHTVLACYNAIIPSLCPELPARQLNALTKQVKAPILYTNVALNNWRAWKKLGIGGVFAPTSYHVNATLDFPVSLGGYKFASEPDDPINVHMERFCHRPNEGLSVREQRRLGRHELLATPFATIERNIREQLTGMLSDGGFDPAADIAGITVNRWAHGYAGGYSDLEDPWYPSRNDERYPHVIGRKPFGRIAIANSDSGASAMLESAVGQAHRAIKELES